MYKHRRYFFDKKFANLKNLLYLCTRKGLDNIKTLKIQHYEKDFLYDVRPFDWRNNDDELYLT